MPVKEAVSDGEHTQNIANLNPLLHHSGQLFFRAVIFLGDARETSKLSTCPKSFAPCACECAANRRPINSHTQKKDF